MVLMPEIFQVTLFSIPIRTTSEKHRLAFEPLGQLLRDC